jgi:hypothetical protein
MKVIALSLMSCLAAIAFADEPASKIPFQGDVGKVPDGWSIAKTGKGSGGDWKLVEDKDAKGFALAQTKADKKAGFNICVADKASVSIKDLDLSVFMKPMAGEVDQGGGLVWRFKDGDNYYIARMNPLEDNFRVYKVVAGKRLELGSAKVEAEAGKWHTLRIVQQGNKIECYFNGKKYLQAEDDAFTDAGKIGLWTKADAQTRFAGLTVRELQSKE